MKHMLGRVKLRFHRMSRKMRMKSGRAKARSKESKEDKSEEE